MKILQPYHLLALAGILLLPFSFLEVGHQTVDIHLHDTYFVIDGITFIRGIATLLFICWAINMIAHKVLLPRWLTWAYVIMTLVAVTMSIPFSLFASNKYDRWLWVASGLPMPWFIIIFIIAQAILLINITGGIINQVIKNKGHRTAL